MRELESGPFATPPPPLIGAEYWLAFRDLGPARTDHAIQDIFNQMEIVLERLNALIQDCLVDDPIEDGDEDSSCIDVGDHVQKMLALTSTRLWTKASGTIPEAYLPLLPAQNSYPTHAPTVSGNLSGCEPVIGEELVNQEQSPADSDVPANKAKVELNIGQDGVEFLCQGPDCGLKFPSFARLKDHFDDIHKREDSRYSGDEKYSKEEGDSSESEDGSIPITRLKRKTTKLAKGVPKKKRRGRPPKVLSGEKTKQRINDRFPGSDPPGNDDDHDDLDDDQDFTCDECGRVCPNRGAFIQHKETHNKANDCICDHCGKGFKNERYLQSHISYSHMGKTWICEDCGKVFKQPSSWRSHKAQKHAKVAPRRAHCEYCEKTFMSNTTLRLHQGVAHQIGDFFQCEECDRKCASQTQLEEHVRTKHLGVMYPCSKCGKSFHHRQTLKRHVVLKKCIYAHDVPTQADGMDT